MNKLNNLNELSKLIAERVKHALGPEKLLKIDSDAFEHIHVGQVKYVDYERDSIPEDNSLFP